MSETPRTDAIVSQFPETCGLNEIAAQYNALLDHARALERFIHGLDAHKCGEEYNAVNEMQRRLRAYKS